ncbi:MarR family winged helix-turn-helix transcriptional regulator [Humibacter ginsenosidimutans]|uniref:MarR family transcriptional regulator n=1 Tax=Humibacter ginsenosidimutans TaxID=2599293 RepID=A0A5B8M1M8_9MICO|nr:MarR family transcriptional regulator [Humibacter ginsenosidimutans]QDZ13622.1 MarR family transcriptional regulator [Humibacter ginsenosidimutans]
MAGTEDTRTRRRVTGELKRRFRDVNNQIALLSHHVSARVELRDIDLDCLDFLAQHGPASPSALARRVGVHPATMTGVVDRLEKGGWIQRERDADDRRAVVLSVRREAIGEVFRHYDGMNSQLDAVCDAYSPAELALISGFLERTADAGRRAVAEFSEGD